MKVAVVMGGYSGESVISLRSGQLILNNLDQSKYQTFEVHILKEGWYVLINDQKYTLDKSDFSFTLNQEKITFDVIVNTIHGTPGEDGHLQAYWELLEIPYTGCNFYQSALTFNKRDTLSVLAKFNIPKAKSIYLTKGTTINKQVIADELALPFFVKPNQSGSSLGVSKVTDLSQFDKALEFAFAEDSDILIESFLQGIEVSVGVFHYKGETKVLGITEIVSQTDFFDYEAKYLGKSEEITPARLTDEVRIRVEQTAKKVYEALGMSGFSRTDFIIMNGIPHFIEMNTNPGLSPQSIFPQQAQYAKLDFGEMLDNEIQLAFQRKLIWKK
ncbi:D-alanine--D-alanine ligase [Flavobacterium columnare NBRC 100251 = ATCC 23463]|uniref:D-alanine--D-alanine ligase n=1 Tax=Flavobacterium columnare (strain ATCC 49512 / CIP 103533 / TG 44/87) TaxID=1041826 RepID=G8X5H0_FLACA|nr:D-alanine--D-alanine ligase [Flavobacterium columnare]AEW86202.1 D-alanyl-alanine synthetase A [Flavobacterium columnare ATCC 49512]MBF6657059.1 D-alanine--D-alanine ligase [Flavobacterium columnare]MEB3800728.1 D-alanine--D-alanine ligase [Flavobacterium columnare]OOB83668.1 D-alanine--D-alanine ligase A [Flavobacterium columnare]PDS27219.1 D-alanine--D-alanine ligase [Flavobacterium columnare NBRC 100251 = ATCC 23463]